MTRIVKNGRFQENAPAFDWVAHQTGVVSDAEALDIQAETDPRDLIEMLPTLQAVRIAFPAPSDGRGFSLARFLRQSGFDGHIRAFGPLHSDQYPLALRCGIDDIEIPDAMAERQSEPLWDEAMQRVHGGYRERLMHNVPIHGTAA